MRKNSGGKKMKGLILGCLVLSVFAITGCNTLKGLGKDLECLGQSLSCEKNATPQVVAQEATISESITTK